MANDYNGYIATYREYQRGDHYRKALTGWGPHSSDYLATRLVQMAGHLKQATGTVLPTESDRELADAVGAAKIEADQANNDARAAALGDVGAQSVAAYEASLPDDGGAASVVDQPRTSSASARRSSPGSAARTSRTTRRCAWSGRWGPTGSRTRTCRASCR